MGNKTLPQTLGCFFYLPGSKNAANQKKYVVADQLLRRRNLFLRAAL